MLLKSIIIFVICKYMRGILNINMCKVYVNYKSLLIEGQCYVFMSLAQGSCTVAASSRENRSLSYTYATYNFQAITIPLMFRESTKLISIFRKKNYTFQFKTGHVL